MSRFVGTLLLLALLPLAAVGARDILVLDGSASLARRDPGGLTIAAAELILLAAERERAMSIHGLSGALAYSSPERRSEEERAAVVDALLSLQGREGENTAGDLSYALAALGRSEVELAAGEAGRLYLLTDGVSSHTIEEWEALGLTAAELIEDPASWARRSQARADAELAELLAPLGDAGWEPWWIAPAGQPPGPETLRAIRAAGGRVVAGGGMADLQQLLRRMDPGSWTIPLGTEESVVQVPPGCDLLSLAFCKPGARHKALAIQSPGGGSVLLGLGETGGKIELTNPTTGEWTVKEGDLNGFAAVQLEVSLSLASLEPLDAPATMGQLRSSTIELRQRGGRGVDPDEFDRVVVEARVGDGEARVLPRRESGFRWSQQLPETLGSVPLHVRAVLTLGPWEKELELTSSVDIMRLELVHTMPAEPVASGVPLPVTFFVRRDGRAWDEALLELELSGLEQRPRSLRGAGAQAIDLVPEVGSTSWSASGAAIIQGRRAALEVSGVLRAGKVDLIIEAAAGTDADPRVLGREGWHGTLRASNSVPAPITVQLHAREGETMRLLGTLDVDASPGVGTRPSETLDVELPAPLTSGAHAVVLIASVTNGQGFPEEILELEFVVSSWWERHGSTLLAFLGLLVMVGVVTGAVLRQRPWLQGELEAVAPPAATGERLPLVAQSRTYGSRRFVLDGGATLEHLAAHAERDVELTLHPRRGDLGLVWPVLENTGGGTIRVDSREVPPGHRLVLSHGATLRLGDLELRYRHPLLAGMTYVGRV